MNRTKQIEVAVLLATYNGDRFVEQQISSLKKNETHFTLHWLDDHSTDGTRETVRTAVSSTGIALKEWHQPQHQGVPGVFFQLLECVDADIYLFCDQDDIWQTGKIDATVAALLPDIELPILCFSDPFIFRDHEPEVYHRLSDITRVRLEVALQESRLFMAGVANGHTQGFTRSLRDIFIRHKDVARSHAYMHDEWMHNIAVATGGSRIIADVPTTLARYHTNNASSAFGSWRGKGAGYVSTTWHERQLFRRVLSRHAKGFILASQTLPPGPKLERLLSVAHLLASLDQRQSLTAVTQLVRRGVMWPSKRVALELTVACLLSNA